MKITTRITDLNSALIVLEELGQSRASYLDLPLSPRDKGDGDLRLVSDACGRCGGEGYIYGHSHVEGGICFACNGAHTKNCVKDISIIQDARRQKTAHNKRVKAAAEYKAGQAAAMASLSDECRAWVEAGERVPSFVHDILARAGRWEMTVKQREAIEKAYLGAQKYLATIAAREPCPHADGDRVEIEGTIVSEKTYFSDYGETIKILVDTGLGWTVWSTLPSAIRKATKGSRVKFTATLQATDDPSFVKAKRPSKALLIEGE